MNILHFLTATTSTGAVPCVEGCPCIDPIVETTEAAKAVLGFNPINFVSNLKYMGIGMLTIFIIIGVIILSTMLVNKVFSKKEKD